MIKINIEMPKTCNGCFACVSYEDWNCQLKSDNYPDNDVTEYVWGGTKPDWCPLEEVANEQR